MTGRNEEDNVKKDYEFSRETYYELIEKGKESLETMVEVAKESEHPRAFEALSTMLRNISEINGQLMELNKKNKDINSEEIKQIENQTNNVFVGTVSELQKMIKEKKPSEMLIDAKPKKP